MFNAQLLIVTRGTGIFILLVPIMITDLHIPKNTKPKFPDPRSRRYSILVSGSCFMSSGLNKLRTLFSSRALILSLMVIAVNVTLLISFDGFSGFLFLLFKIQAIMTIKARRLIAAAVAAAMAVALNLSEDSVLCCILGLVELKSA